MMVQRYVWDDSISTGVVEIDIQHKQFLAVLHDFADQLEQGVGAGNVKKLLAFLKYYGEWHFDREEMCALRHLCPMSSTNSRAHEKYMETVDSLMAQCRQGKPTEELANSVYQILTTWLVSHIMNVDKKIGEHVRLCQKKTAESSIS